MSMNVNTVLPILKSNLNIMSDVRDSYLTAIIDGTIEELEDEQGLALDDANPYHLMFVADYAAWRYRSRGENGPMPINIRFRLNNMVIHQKANPIEPNGI